MKKIILTVFLYAICMCGFGRTWLINSLGNTFSPSTLTINQGDDVNFVLTSSHNAVEVSQTVWNNNGNSSINGFSVNFGGGIVTALELPVGTHHYVCSPHASIGMKGTITVQATSAVESPEIQISTLIYPNPLRDRLTVQLNSAGLNELEIKLFDSKGQLVNNLLSKTKISGLFLQSFYLKSNTPAGFYFVQIAFGLQGSYTKVLIMN